MPVPERRREDRRVRRGARTIGRNADVQCTTGIARTHATREAGDRVDQPHLVTGVPQRRSGAPGRSRPADPPPSGASAPSGAARWTPARRVRASRRARHSARTRNAVARSASRASPTSSGRSSAAHTAALAARTAAVGRAASARDELVGARRGARARAPPRRRSPGPARRAAGMRSPVITAISAALVPTTRGSVWLAPPAGSMPDPRLGQRDHAVVGRDPHVALQRELEAEPDRVALHRRDHRHRDRAQQTPHVATPPGVAHREHRRRGAELLEVGTGGEVVAGGGEQRRRARRDRR